MSRRFTLAFLFFMVSMGPTALASGRPAPHFEPPTGELFKPCPIFPTDNLADSVFCDAKLIPYVFECHAARLTNAAYFSDLACVEFGLAVGFSATNDAVGNAIFNVGQMAAPSQVGDGVVRFVPVSMAAFHATRARPNECFQDKPMHSSRDYFSVVPNGEHHVAPCPNRLLERSPSLANEANCSFVPPARSPLPCGHNRTVRSGSIAGESWDVTKFDRLNVRHDSLHKADCVEGDSGSYRYPFARYFMSKLAQGLLFSSLLVSDVPAGHERPIPKAIGIPPVRQGGSDPSLAGSKPLPTLLPEGKKYIVFFDCPLLIDWDSSDGGDIELTEYKGPRVFATDKIICSQPADQDNADVTSITSKNIYEIKYKTSGSVFLRVMPALGKPNAEGKPTPLTRDDISRRTLQCGDKPRPPPDDPVEPDAEVRTLTSQLRTAYMGESAPDKSTSVKELASLYRTMAKSLTANDASVAKLTTQLQFGEAMKAARSSLIGDKIPEVRNVVGDFFDKKWVVAENAKFDATAKGKAAASLNQAAKALESVVR